MNIDTKQVEQKKIIHRLRRTEGQIRGVQKMIDEDKECIDIITQLSAIRSSIDRVMGIIVAENLKDCFENPKNDTQDQTKKIDQAIAMIIKK
ncbi:metal-sensitive transcriptional regulator [Carnobacterium pleistocenium]|uniref:metal-sensitive transcriptional regulator n=1 Tax=Carnobacterium pleistocenium TaxID=181073 RepID=UPI0005542DC2|nr:metal-sensitive transcriptional regulator [Carnobacterium pleistocenium]